MPAPAQFSAPADRFAGIMDALCRAMANEGNARRLAGPFLLLIWIRLRRLAARFARLAERGPAPTRHSPARNRPPSPDRRKNLPRNFGWLRRLLPGTAAAASQLDHLLADPEMTALIAATPATGRTLRPLCHLLGVRPPPALRLPRRQPAVKRQPPSTEARRKTPSTVITPPSSAPSPEAWSGPRLHPRFMPPRRRPRFRA